jgi:tetratricopeptide (TPR) repeat protein
MTDSIGVWLAVLGVPTIGGILWWAFGKPSFAKVCRYVRSFHAEKATGTHFAVLVADLEGDDEGRTQTHLLAESLHDTGGLEVIKMGRKLSDSDPGSTAWLREKAEKTGRGWLDEHKADVLVWGQVVSDHLVLHFLSCEEGVGGNRESAQRFGEELTLPRNFEKALGVQLVAVALSQIALVPEKQGEYLVSLLRPVVTKLESLLAGRAAMLPPEQRASLHFSLGLAASTVGEQAGERKWLKTAITAYRAALEEWTRERVPIQWAGVQNNLGITLSSLGEQESDPARLREAVAAYCAALEEFTRECLPLQWAMVQSNLGNTLRTLGEQEKDPAQLEAAVIAYRAALEEYTRERVPLQWAMTQNNLGAALGNLGEREKDPARLEEAVVAFRAALEELTRDRVPLLWAATQNNLGNTLFRLSERESGTARLEKAVAAYRAALEEYTRECTPLDWAMTQNNLGGALATLGKRESDPAQLKRAITAFRAALEVYKEANSGHRAAEVENNLRRAEAG